MSLAFNFTAGTHRIATPQATLARIAPVLHACGITRCTSVTHLDHLGVPVYCAIRPAGLVLQVANGKGMTRESARVSALMEAIEMHHAEHPVPAGLRRASEAELVAEGATVIGPRELAGWSDGYAAPDFRFEWIRGESLTDGTLIWAPASAACFARTPAPVITDSNGLASGNHLLEASLHALYELLERDALAQVSENGRLRVRERCRNIDLASIPDAALHGLVHRIEQRQSKVVLLWVPSRVAVHTFWAILLNRLPDAPVSTLNLGAGCHCDPVVAAARAVTEAAQSRLTFIHGAREDRTSKPVDRATQVQTSPAYRFFDRLPADTAWNTLPGVADRTTRDLEQAHAWLIGELRTAGQRLWRFDLTQVDIGIPVVKIIAPGLDFNRRLL